MVGRLYNSVNSAGTKLYSHNTSFNVISCGNRRNIEGGDSSGGIVGRVENRLSYAGIASKAIADAIINQIIIKYCFNTGDVSDGGRKGGIIGTVYNYVGLSGTERGGKAITDISNNYNTGTVSNTTGNPIGGIIGGLQHDVFDGNNCFVDTLISSNVNSGSINGTKEASGIVTYCITQGVGISSSNVKIDIINNFNYSMDLSGGNDNWRGGVVGTFVNNCSRTTLSNNYSAYKRKDADGNDMNDNIYGTNPAASNGANVGEDS